MDHKDVFRGFFWYATLPSFPPGFQMSSEHESENSENESPEQRDNPGFQGSFRVFSFYKGKHVLK